MTTSNTKAAGWDIIGGLFWEKGRASARPSASEIDWFLARLEPGAHCAIIGASTKDLAAAASDAGLNVTVFDFSANMCRDLARALDNSGIKFIVQDITAPLRVEDFGYFDAVLSDRLINRFTHDEAIAGCRGMLQLAKPGGTVRTSIMAGLYKMDERMIAEGQRRGILHTFYDTETRTIDFARAGQVLEDCLLPHGEIDRELLIKWYRARGRESRYESDDVIRIAAGIRSGARRLSLRSTTSVADNSTVYYDFHVTE